MACASVDCHQGRREMGRQTCCRRLRVPLDQDERRDFLPQAAVRNSFENIAPLVTMAVTA